MTQHLGEWGQPVHMPHHVSPGGPMPYEVTTVNADGTVDLRNRLSRATRSRVAAIAGWTPTAGDQVVAVDLGGNPQTPAIIAIQNAASQQAAAPFIGQISMSGLSTPGAGWITCDGAAVTAAAHPLLRAALLGDGSPHGTDGSGNPKVPNLNRGAFPMGAGNGHALGATGGEDTHTLTVGEMPSHNHGGATGNDSPDHTHSLPWATTAGGSSGAYAPGGTTGGATATSGASTRHTHSVSAQGGGAAHENKPLYTAVTFVIYAGA